MKNLLFFSLIITILCTASKCKDDVVTPTPKGAIEWNIKAKFNEQPFQLNKIYSYNGKKVRFSRLSFYVSNISTSINTYSAITQNVDVPIVMIDFKDIDDSVKASKGLILNLEGFSTGNANQFSMAIGVASDMNSKKPKDYPSTNPLSETSNYWDAWNSYIFFKLEGSLDKDGDGQYETGITLHAGGNEVYQNMNFRKAFSIKENETPPLSMELDLNKLINGIDMETYNSTHQIGDLPTMKKMMGNFQTALIIK